MRIARQIAAGLEEAHGKGIVHRDLKPANIKIKPDGTVKVLDFGLTKTVAQAEVHPTDSPTLTMGATEVGVILGTAAYMAAEQARGKAVDKRADIWAFGVGRVGARTPTFSWAARSAWACRGFPPLVEHRRR